MPLRNKLEKKTQTTKPNSSPKKHTQKKPHQTSTKTTKTQPTGEKTNTQTKPKKAKTNKQKLKSTPPPSPGNIVFQLLDMKWKTFICALHRWIYFLLWWGSPLWKAVQSFQCLSGRKKVWRSTRANAIAGFPLACCNEHAVHLCWGSQSWAAMVEKTK